MKKYTYSISYTISVDAPNEDVAYSLVERDIPYYGEHEEVELLEVESDDHEWEEADRIYDERHL